MLGIHHPKPLDVTQSKLADPLLGLAQHRLGAASAARTLAARILRKRYAAPPPALEGAPADAFRGGDGGMSAALEYRAEHEIIDRRPSRIGLRDRLLVEVRI